MHLFLLYEAYLRETFEIPQFYPKIQHVKFNLVDAFVKI